MGNKLLVKLIFSREEVFCVSLAFHRDNDRHYCTKRLFGVRSRRSENEGLNRVFTGAMSYKISFYGGRGSRMPSNWFFAFYLIYE